MPMPPQPGEPRNPETGEVERLLSQLEHGGAGVARLPAARSRSRPGVGEPLGAGAGAGAAPSRASVWAPLAAGVALVAGMTQWPYAHACGLGLAGYLVAAGAVFVTGAWCAHASWRARMGFTHLIALVIMFASAGLAAVEVLPRMGDSPVEVTWRCAP